MATLKNLRRVLIYSILSVVVFLLLGFAAIHTQQEILRHRTQQLLTDIRTIDLRRTTFTEVQPILRRWRSESHYGQPCSAERCDVTIALPYATFYKSGLVYWSDDWFVHALIRATLLARAHPFVAVASVSVRKGIVWGKSFTVGVEVEPSRVASDPYSTYSYMLDGEAESVSRFVFGRVFAQHPDYQVGRPGACTGCLAVWAKFTPYASPADVSRLMQFNLNCITRWHPCRTQRDLMPTAWAQLQREEELPYDPPACTPARAEIAARDAGNAAIIQIASLAKPSEEDRKAIAATARLIEPLKHTGSWKVGTNKQVWIPPAYIASTVSDALRPGTRWILLFDINLNSVNPHECGVVPLNDKNLALVRKGISQDYLAGDDE